MILLAFMPIINQAQSVKRQCISSYGTSIEPGSVAIRQTVGQPYVTTVSHSEEISVLHGFQQPVSFKTETIYPGPIRGLSLEVYPNPAAEFVTLKSEEIIENSFIRVMDINSKLILSEQLSQLQSFDINCMEWENGIYIITVSDENQNISSIKITINK